MSRKRKGEHCNHERWLVSYADFITLLFAFFVVLYASSKADQRKQMQVAHAINSAFNAMGLFPASGSGGGPVTSTEISDTQDLTALAQQDLERIRAELQHKLASEIAAHVISLQMGRDGLVISLREAGFFDSGSAAPHPDSLSAIGRIATSLATTPYDLRIEGHTDDVPIHNAQFDTNWELSTARATRIARIFIENYRVAPQRLSASGYAEYHPVASNDTADGRAINRRVDIIVLPRIAVSTRPSPVNAIASAQPLPAPR